MRHKHRKKVYLSSLIIACLITALVFGIGGFLAGNATSGTNIITTGHSRNTAHFTCKECGYSFNDLSTFRVEYNHTWHYYYCPSCGELLTSDVGDNPMNNMITNDTYSRHVINNWD